MTFSPTLKTSSNAFREKTGQFLIEVGRLGPYLPPILIHWELNGESNLRVDKTATNGPTKG